MTAFYYAQSDQVINSHTSPKFTFSPDGMSDQGTLS